jgi:hypothetical protein
MIHQHIRNAITELEAQLLTDLDTTTRAALTNKARGLRILELAFLNVGKPRRHLSLR